MPDEKVLVLKPLKSTVEAKLEATQKELNEYKNRAPKIVFCFDDEQKTTETIMYSSSGYNAADATALAQVLSEDFIPKQIVSKQAYFARILKNAKGQVPADEVKRFTQAYDEYLVQVHETYCVRACKTRETCSCRGC